MTTPSIYTVGQLRAYLQGKRAVLCAPLPPSQITGASIDFAKAQIALYDEVIALCTGIETHEAGKAPVYSRSLDYIVPRRGDT